ncbi:ABC transporter ATP-binding protein [uncultured Aquimarina sp.]|uniref:ATP-binding cassette domain-containing protein n=1 Tax=uncultured Aquimarina sp. TaxID=575652 RepID=UPI00261273FF|nr:ABC transporter ATP-binding protein [uncultured Aquimarina sp.]
MIRIKKVIPRGYENISVRFFILSFILLVLDIFSVFLLIPLIISLLDQDSSFNFLPFEILGKNRLVLAGIVIAFFLIKNYVAIVINKFQTKTAYDLGSVYSLSLSKHYILGNYSTFKQQKKSTIIKDIIFVANDFVGNVLLSVNIIISEVTLLLILGIIGVFYNYTITILIIIILGIIVFIYKRHNQKDIDKINETRSSDFDNNISNLTNLLNGYLSIKSSGLIAHFLEKFNVSNKKLNRSYAILQSKRLNSSRQTEIILVFLVCFIFISINTFSLRGVTPIVFLSVFASLLFKSIPSVNRLNVAFTNLKSNIYTLDIIEKRTIENTKTEVSKPPISFDNRIILKDISFSYNNEKEILKNINLTIDKGQFIAISGASGIGKTTLLNIIAKLINPTAGEIFVDNTKITEENKYDFFDLFTYLTQRPFIYEGSILDNLILSKKTYDIQKIQKLLKIFKIDKVIEQFPDQLETYIGSDGTNLSGGQLQRICIIRAILNKPEILILDEATNNLDKETEIEVLQFLKSFAIENKTTVILVSHHIKNMIYIYDKIIELNNN